MPRLFASYSTNGWGSSLFCYTFKEFAITAGWTIKGSATALDWRYEGETDPLDVEDQGAGGAYDTWVTSSGVRWVVLENDGRELMIVPKFNDNIGVRQWVGIIYSYKGQSGFDGSIAGPLTLPGPSTVERETNNTRNIWARPGGELGGATFNNSSRGWAFFWGHTQDENGAHVLGYAGHDDGISSSSNTQTFLIAPVVASAQSDYDPDPVVLVGTGNVASTSFANSYWWNYNTDSDTTNPYIPSQGGFRYFGDDDDSFEGSSSEPGIIQCHYGHLDDSANECYKGPLTENACVISSIDTMTIGDLFDVGFADGEGQWMCFRTNAGGNWLVPWPNTELPLPGHNLNVRAAQFRGIRAQTRDATPPTITHITSPTDLSSASDAIQFEVVDVRPGVAGVYACITYDNNNQSDCVYMGSAFTAPHLPGSSVASIQDGFRYTVQRRGGWLGNFTLDVYAVDLDGNTTGPVSQSYTIPAHVCYVPSIPSPDLSMSVRTVTLLELRNWAKDLSDMDNTDFVPDAEWNLFVNSGLKELFDLLVESHDQEFLLATYSFQVTPPTNVYTLPGDFHVLKGVDFSTCCFPEQTVDGDPGEQDTYSVQTQQMTQDVIQLRPYTFHDRHAFVGEPYAYDPYHGQRMEYRIFTEKVTDDIAGAATELYYNRIRFKSVRPGYAQVWYIPTVPHLAADTDFVPAFSGYEEYASIYAAIHALAKEESDTGPLQLKLDMMKDRILRMAAVRDAGYPGRITDVEKH